MQLRENNVAVSTTRVLPSPLRLLIFAVALPAFVAATNQYVFNHLASSIVLRPWLYPWMAFTAAVLSWSVGRYLHPAWFRWLLFVWCLLLLDVLTIAACQDNRVGDESGYLLVSAQVNLLTFWAIMGPHSWQLRLPTVLVGTAFIFALCMIISSSFSTGGWALSMMLAAIVGGILCIGLRLLGFRLRNVHELKLQTREDAALQARQFGLRHMFLWATAAVPLLLATRGIDLLFFIPWLDGESAFAATLLAICVATINLTAIWCVLGKGRWIARLTSLLIIPLLIAAGLTLYSDYLISLYGAWANVPILDAFINMHEQWYVWLWVSAALLAALLLFLRASGFLLLRNVHACRTT